MGLLSIIRKIKKKEKEMRILMVGLDNSGKTTIVLKINGEDTSVISPTLGFNIKTITYQNHRFLGNVNKNEDKDVIMLNLLDNSIVLLFDGDKHVILLNLVMVVNVEAFIQIDNGRYTLNIWDVGGQKTIRSYWRNYFEQTDGLVWVVDSSDLRRLDDCKMELDNLLKEERLSGSSLLILANKQDIKGALAPAEIAKAWDLGVCYSLGPKFEFSWCNFVLGRSIQSFALASIGPPATVLNLEAMDKSRHWMIVGCSAYTGEGLLEGFDWLVQDIASRIYMLD
ncbi:hypothetical protein TSUD_409110 [Trifolium subterraneum]|uniref:ADP-ribosylation factor-like protein 2 n=1 Tax=Trifolium subterraneum TaxID=3900 RepID=A0A2Z6PIX7_TRISU|nr:hypothetical protein TSUD_409110 [Trifolium subterraneum]